jgi:opacity protein-like surface antigen
MKKRVLLPLLLAGMWATPAMAGTYVSGSVGLGLLSNSEVKDSHATHKDAVEYNAGIPFGVAVGYKFDDYRLEGAIGYQTYGVDKTLNDSSGLLEPAAGNGHLSIWSFMANGYYDINLKGSSISPYLTAGLGLDSVKASSDRQNDRNNGFAWQLGTGVGIKASENVVVDLGYRYFKAADVTVKGFGDISVAGSNILAGVRYNF